MGGAEASAGRRPGPFARTELPVLTGPKGECKCVGPDLALGADAPGDRHRHQTAPPNLRAVAVGNWPPAGPQGPTGWHWGAVPAAPGCGRVELCGVAGALAGVASRGGRRCTWTLLFGFCPPARSGGTGRKDVAKPLTAPSDGGRLSAPIDKVPQGTAD